MKNKKMIFGFLAVLAIAAMAAWNVSFGSKTDRLSDIALANVEALAEREDEEKKYIISTTWGDCYVVINQKEVKGKAPICNLGSDYVNCPSCTIGTVK